MSGTGLSFDDTAIERPEHDRFGIDPFAQALAKSIAEMTAPKGVVLAINGAWGSGKSSAINLILHHLEQRKETERPHVVRFAPWWFRGEEALALAVFQELHAALGTLGNENARMALAEIGRRVLAPFAALVANAATAGLGGEVAEGAVSGVADLLATTTSLEEQHRRIADALNGQNKRFLIVIDDIDRLGPDEALLIFRLVKSVGHLPNILYLLAFDREMAEKAVAERFPSEGPHYLEKIIQASFDLPNPLPYDLHREMFREFEAICGAPAESHLRDFWNIFHDAVAPLLRTPRDLARLANTLRVTWPAVQGEVHPADFLAIEALRLFRPEVYRAIRAYPDKVCGGADRTPQTRDIVAEEYDRLFLGDLEEPEREGLRTSLKRLFPQLESIWGRGSYGSDWYGLWRQERRICSRERFDTYFRFSLGESAIPAATIDELIRRAGEPDHVREVLLSHLRPDRRDGSTRVPLLLEELRVHASRIADEDVQSLLTTLFALADDIDVPEDEARGILWTGDNNLRLEALTDGLLQSRFDLGRRSEILHAACEKAALTFLALFALHLYEEHHPREGGQPVPPEKRLVDEETAAALRQLALQRIRAAAQDGTLAEKRHLVFLIFRWKEWAPDGATKAHRWTDEHLGEDRFVLRLAEALTSTTRAQGFSDHVVLETPRVRLDGLDPVLDVARFRARLDEIEAKSDLGDEDRAVIDRFREGLRLAAGKR